MARIGWDPSQCLSGTRSPLSGIASHQSANEPFPRPCGDWLQLLTHAPVWTSSLLQFLITPPGDGFSTPILLVSSALWPRRTPLLWGNLALVSGRSIPPRPVAEQDFLPAHSITWSSVWEAIQHPLFTSTVPLWDTAALGLLPQSFLLQIQELLVQVWILDADHGCMDSDSTLLPFLHGCKQVALLTWVHHDIC